MAYATAGILVRLQPAKAQAILARAADYSENRLVCGAHFRRDIVAGQALGTLLAAELMEKPAFRAEFDAAQAELRAAHLAD
jgi:acid phosphatase (class A)